MASARMGRPTALCRELLQTRPVLTIQACFSRRTTRAASRKSVVGKTTAPRQSLPYQPSQQKPSPRPQPNPAPDNRQTLAELVNQRRTPLFGLALLAGGLGAYLSYLAVAILKEPAPCTCGSDGAFLETETPTGRPKALNEASAEDFDKSLNRSEWLMGVTSLRREMATHARGHVLEVAVGTGRNLRFYDWDDVSDLDPDRRLLRQLDKSRYRPAPRAGDDSSPEMTSFTGVDISGDMLEAARRRIASTVPGAAEVLKERKPAAWGTGPTDDNGRVEIVNLNGNRLRLVKSNAQLPLPDPPPISSAGAQAQVLNKAKPQAPTNKYDTVLQTFGLCSVSSPTALLANLASAVQPGTGRIILLEHGRSWWDALARFQDRYAPRHFERFQCWWNRDIEGLVRQAARDVPGLEVVEVRRRGRLQFGTLLWIELRYDPDKAALAAAVRAKIEAARAQTK